MVRESTTHKRAGYRCNAIHSTNDPSVDGSLPEWYCVGDDDQRTGKDAGRTYTSDGSTNDEGYRCWCSTTNKRTKLEDGNGSQINPLDAEEGIELAKKELEGASGKEVG